MKQKTDGDEEAMGFDETFVSFEYFQAVVLLVLTILYLFPD